MVPAMYLSVMLVNASQMFNSLDESDFLNAKGRPLVTLSIQIHHVPELFLPPPTLTLLLCHPPGYKMEPSPSLYYILFSQLSFCLFLPQCPILHCFSPPNLIQFPFMPHPAPPAFLCQYFLAFSFFDAPFLRTLFLLPVSRTYLYFFKYRSTSTTTFLFSISVIIFLNLEK